MADRPPFDSVRACFWLIAFVLCVHCVVALTGIGWCVWHGEAIVEGKFRCDNIGAQLNELLSGALAAALAFAGGTNRRG
jgi:hypothetical protein